MKMSSYPAAVAMKFLILIYVKILFKMLFSRMIQHNISTVLS